MERLQKEVSTCLGCRDRFPFLLPCDLSKGVCVTLWFIILILIYHGIWTSRSKGREVPFHQGCDDTLSQLPSRNTEDTKQRPSGWCSLNYCEHWSPSRGHETALGRGGGVQEALNICEDLKGICRVTGAAWVGEWCRLQKLFVEGMKTGGGPPPLPKQNSGTARMRKMVKNSHWR